MPNYLSNKQTQVVRVGIGKVLTSKSNISTHVHGSSAESSTGTDVAKGAADGQPEEHAGHAGPPHEHLQQTAGQPRRKLQLNDKDYLIISTRAKKSIGRNPGKEQQGQVAGVDDHAEQDFQRGGHVQGAQDAGSITGKDNEMQEIVSFCIGNDCLGEGGQDDVAAVVVEGLGHHGDYYLL
jgi:hypothetical protein